LPLFFGCHPLAANSDNANIWAKILRSLLLLAEAIHASKSDHRFCGSTAMRVWLELGAML